MSEAFHQWVNNMPWWERLYYEMFDPQAITCSTHPVYPAWPFVLLIVVVVVCGIVALYWLGDLSVQSRLDEAERERQKRLKAMDDLKRASVHSKPTQ